MNPVPYPNGWLFWLNHSNIELVIIKGLPAASKHSIRRYIERKKKHTKHDA